MTLNLKKLEQLVAIAEEMNFSRAADRLGMTQPALSRSIAQLEATCGLRMFERSRSGVALTAAGADLLVDARQLLGQAAAIERNLLQQSRGEAGRVTFGIGPMAANFLMTDLLVASLMEEPLLTLAASMGTTEELVAGVLDAAFDFCVCAAHAVEPHPALAVRPLVPFKMGYFVRGGHPLAQVGGASGGALAWEALAPYPRATGQHRRSPELREQGTFGPLGVTVECDDFDVLRRWTLRSDAIWLTSEKLVGAELASGALCEIALPRGDGLPVGEMVLVTLRGRTQSPAVRKVMAAAIRLMRK